MRACGAERCEHVVWANGEPVTVTCNGKPKYEITGANCEA